MRVELKKELESLDKFEFRELSSAINIANTIRHFADERQFNTADVANTFGVDDITASRLLAGTHEFDIKTLSKIGVIMDEEIIKVKRDAKS